jgi:outer membrane biosynthesis protein TonB
VRSILLLLFALLVCHSAPAQQWSRELDMWAARVRATIRPKIHYHEALPTGAKIETQVEVALATDGTIESFKLIKESGVESWDTAVMEALRATERLPLPKDGAVPSKLVMHLRPN